MANRSNNKSIFDLGKQLQQNSVTQLGNAIKEIIVQAKDKKLTCTPKEITKAFLPLKPIIQRLCTSTWEAGWDKAYQDVDNTKFNRVANSEFVVEFAKDTRAKTPDSVVETIQQKREKEEVLSREFRVGNLKQSAFGRNYVNKRNEYIAADLQQYYLQELNTALPQYFEARGIKNTKDADLYKTLFPLLSPVSQEALQDDENRLKQSLARLANAAAGQKTARRLERVVITELNAAYNLGRLEAFMSKNIKLVRWNNDAENKAGFAPGTAYQRIQQYTTSKRYFGFPYDPLLHRVCPICQERAKRKTIYGIGIYAIEDLLSPTATMSAPPLHPYCECYLEPVYREEENRIKKELSKKRILGSALAIDEQVAGENRKAMSRWVIGTSVTAGAVLSMAVMYKMFKKSLPRQWIESVTTAKAALEQAVVTGAIEGLVKPILLPEEKVKPKLSLQETRQPQVQEQVQKLDAVLRTENYKSSKVPIAKKIDSDIADSKRLLDKFNLTNPNTSLPKVTPPTSSWDDVISRIQSRIDQYDNFRQRGEGLTAAQRKEIISQYTADLNLLNKEITSLDNSTIDLYTKHQKLTRLRNEAQAALERAIAAEDIRLPDTVNTEAAINSTNKLIQLEDEIAALRKAINQNIELQAPGGFKERLVEIQEQLRANPEIQEQYLNNQSSKINRAFEKLPNDGRVANLVDQTQRLSDLTDQALNNGLTYEKYRQLANAAEHLEDQLDALQKMTRLPNIEVDVDFIARIKPSYAQNDIVLKSQSIKDTRDTINSTQTILNRINYLLEQEKGRLTQQFTTNRGGVTKSQILQRLQAQRRRLVTSNRFDEARDIENQIEQILRAEFTRNNGGSTTIGENSKRVITNHKI
jgi:hypothetical protein